MHLINPPENEMSHSIDFHASQVAWNDEMRSIAPGEELVYEWTADYAGVWMYHCGTSPTLHHIANGMYGMVIVEPTDGLPPVDAEFALVQSEWYLGSPGPADRLEKAMAAAPAPDYVVFNGVANQYKDAPLAVDTGERVRFFVLNAGPSVDSSFHIVGTIFDTVIKEGVQPPPWKRRQLGRAGRGPVTRAGRHHRDHHGRGRPVPHRHACLQLRGSWSARPSSGGRRRPVELGLSGSAGWPRTARTCRTTSRSSRATITRVRTGHPAR